MGVAATHLDWSLVPYVRKSFYKHYKDGLKYVAKSHEDVLINKDQVTEVSIDDKKIYKNEAAYEFALDMTEREVRQGAEGLFHNLNTLQSRSGN